MYLSSSYIVQSLRKVLQSPLINGWRNEDVLGVFICWEWNDQLDYGNGHGLIQTAIKHLVWCKTEAVNLIIYSVTLLKLLSSLVKNNQEWLVLVSLSPFAKYTFHCIL